VRDNKGRTPLTLAAARGREEVVKLLLEIGKADVEAKDNKGRTPLLQAASEALEDMLKPPDQRSAGSWLKYQ
jgi:ankyrin repeat protein